MIPELNFAAAWFGERFQFRLLAGARLRMCVYVRPGGPRRIALEPSNDLFDRLAAQGVAATREWWSVGIDRGTEEPAVLIFPDYLARRMADLSRTSGAVTGPSAPDIRVDVIGGVTGYWVRFCETTQVPAGALEEAKGLLASLEEENPLRETWDVTAAVGQDTVLCPDTGWVGRQLHCLDWTDGYAAAKRAVAGSGILSDPKKAAALEAMALEAALGDDENVADKAALFLRAMRELKNESDPDSHKD